MAKVSAGISIRVPARAAVGMIALAFGAAVGAAEPASAYERVVFEGYEPGAIVVRTHERRLYAVLGDGTALRYKVAVGKPGKQWFGRRVIDGKYIQPAWSPPAEVKRDNPNLPDVIAGGSPHNPMGVAALTIAPGEYAVHGTNRPNSVGRYASYGCIRMLNEDISDLYGRVRIGTPIIVLP
jgi:lipoprotein-anchoring transpeptidase ErfK/SrfK